MKRWMIFSMMGMLGLISPVWAEKAALPAGSAGEVTLDWQKFNELWTRMQQMEKKIEQLEKPENLPPVPFTLTQAAYRGTVGAKKTDMEAVFELDVYDPKNWVKVPFLPSSVALSEARLDGRPVGVIQADDYHQVLLRKPGRHVLRVRFSMRSPKPEEAPQMSFHIQSTPITLLALEFPRPNLEVTVEPSQAIDIRPTGDQGTRLTASIPPTSGFTIRWQKAVPAEPAGPAKVYLDAQNLITVSEGTLKAHWNLSYTILRRGIRELRVQVPDAWNILSVNGDGIQEWKTLDTPSGSVLVIQLAYARRGNLDVAIQMERGLTDKEEVIDLPRLKALDIEREQGAIGVEAKGAVELTVQSAESLQAIDPRELPGGLWQSATQPILFAFRYTKPHALALLVKRHPETPVLTTTVDDANAITVMTSRGQLITKVRYQVRNQLKQYLEMRLPAGSELWSAFVAGEPVKPTLAPHPASSPSTGEGREGMDAVSYRIPLAKSQLGNQGQTGFPVEIIFYRAVPKFWPVGLRSMALPMPDAPVSRMMWSVYLPEEYRFPYFGGDVEKGEGATAWNALVGDAKVSRDEFALASEPTDKPHKLKMGLRALADRMMSAKSAVMADAVAEKQEEVAASLFQAGAPASTATGVLPVAFELPASGQLFHFGQVMVVGQDPLLRMVFVHARIIQALWLLVLGGLVFLAYRRRDGILELARQAAKSLLPTKVTV
jgi:hypothetical protein